MAVRDRLHRSELAVPGSNARALEKAPTLGADVVFLDLEDAVAPDEKEQARANVIAALREGDWSGCSVSVRINGLDTHWCYRDIVEVVEQAGDVLDTILEAYIEDYKTAEQIAGERGYNIDLVRSIIKMVERAEYKRQQAAPGLKITEKAFGVGRRFPIAARHEV